MHGNCLLTSAVNERTVKVKILVKQKDKVIKHYTVLRLRLYWIHQSTELIISIQRHFQQYFSYIPVVRLIGGGNREKTT
jgi:hypothetical protein